jgi:hypothetical protein
MIWKDHFIRKEERRRSRRVRCCSVNWPREIETTVSTDEKKRVVSMMRMKRSSYRGKFEVLRTYSSLSNSCWPCSRLKILEIYFHSRFYDRLSTVNACLPQPYWSALVNARKVYQEYPQSCSPRVGSIEHHASIRLKSHLRHIRVARVWNNH